MLKISSLNLKKNYC